MTIQYCKNCQKPVKWVPWIGHAHEPEKIPANGFWIHTTGRKARYCDLVADPIPMIDGIEHMACRCKRCTGLSVEDQEALRRSVSDLSDIPPERLAAINKGFQEASQRADEIRRGVRNPLS